MSGKKRGRPKTGVQLRTAEVKAYLTEDDAEKLTALAAGLGFESRAQMLTAIFERLLAAGWAPAAWLKLGWQFRNRAQDTGHFKDAGWWNPFASWEPLPVDNPTPKPTPAMPDEQMTARATKELLVEVRKELQPT